jgi:curved DNA-binding protein
MIDPYSILGLQRDASEEDAKQAFRKLAKTCHPDLHPNDPNAEKRFKEINEAYDRICKGDTQEQVHVRTGNFGDIFGNGGFNPFEHIFGEMHRRNQDVHLECRMTLEEAFAGKELSINVPGVNHSSRTVKANIPQGAMHGMRFSVPKGGTQTIPTSPPGDLYINIRILPHERFVRENNDLITMIPVTIFDILLGKDVSVMNIEGRSLNVSIPPGFDSSRKLRLAGQGMSDPRFPANPSVPRGDLLVDLFVQYPLLNDEQRELIKQASEKV